MQRRGGTIDGGSKASEVAKTHILRESYDFPSPNQTITVNEAMTMICRALGYTAQAKELVGAWPANYIALAQQLDLYDDVQATALTDRASAAQIVYNALTSALVYIDADGATKQVNEANGGITMLSSLGGHVDNNGKGYVLLADAAAASVINVRTYVGSFVSTFSNKSGDIIAIEELSTTLQGKISADGKTFTADGVDYDYPATADYTWNNNGNKVTASPVYVENGATSTAAISTGAVAIPKSTTITLAVDLSGKKIKEVYSYSVWNGSKWDQFDPANLNLDKKTFKLSGKTFKFPQTDNKEIDYDAFALVGVSSLDKIAENNIVEIWEGSDGYLNKIAVGTKTVTGTCEEISANGEDFYIDGTKYGLKDGIDPKPGLNETGIAYLDYDGDIAVWEAEDAAAGNYAIFIGARLDTTSDLTASNTTKVALFTKDGDKKEFSTVNNWPTTVTPAGVNQYDIVKYSMNAKGVITTISAVTNNTVATDMNANKTLIDGKSINSNVIVFVQDGTDWSIGDIKNYDKDSTLTNVGSKYVLDSSDKIVALKTSKNAIASDTSFAVINTVTKRMHDDEELYYVKGFVDGKPFEGFVASDCNYTSASAPTVSGVNTGYEGLYIVDVDSANMITGFNGSTLSNTNGVSGTALGIVTKIAGNVVTATDSSVKTSYDIDANAVIYVYDVENEVWSVGSVSDIQADMQIRLFQSSAKYKNDERTWDIVLVWEE